MKEPVLSKAIQEFRNQIDKDDYANLGAKGKYLTVPYRLKFIRDHFGERISIQTESNECSDGMFRFKAKIYLDDQLISVGESKQNVKKDKEFEKQQSVSIGRGLSIAGFFGDEIATAEEMEQFLKTEKQPVKQEPQKPTTNLEEQVENFIGHIQIAAKNCTSQNSYEKNMQTIREEYQTELHQISQDLVLQQRIDDAEILAKQEINNRRK